ncbi:cytochrome-c peroxidase [Paraglaciecola arctica]|uniref:Methylamine utilization protein mauG n=1 Tax=Paraglaciecola arctica BSs20135 TaxID=493475 RepID=K6Z7E5_9ALTE|nr:cytochrome c peroxidase [Paraglaciecola arctica]GAC19355.1 methylamine utilization protein mauG [Paraglaciecola arctica BSs20135]
MCRLTVVASWLCAAVLSMLFFQVKAEALSAFMLSDSCPPGFELTAKNQCRLVNFYQLYDSVQGRGVGGTQTSLPKHRDGFSPQQIDLGRILFFDPALSKDGSMSCASCHQPDKGFSDGLGRSKGFDGRQLTRSAPSLWNVAFLDKFYWDARASTLEEQAVGPLFDANEMANSPEQLLETLNGNSAYLTLFKQTYPLRSQIDLDQVVSALTAFQSSLISLNSRYDRYAHGYHEALNKNEIAGLNVFRSFVARCAECHQPPLFTNNQIAVIGVPEKDGRPLDIGAQKTYQAAKLRGGFKVPTLRNIVKTKPYMHAGNFDDLRETVGFYNKGRGHAIPEGETLQIHWHIWEPNLTEHEMDLIVEFLGTLTDEAFTPKVPETVPSGLSPVDDNYQKLHKNNNQKLLSRAGD